MRTLYYNGSLYTGDPENPEAGAMVVENGEILWAGGKPGERLAWEEIFGEDVPEHKVDLKGRFVTSGFIDSHMHMVEYGKLLGEVSLADHTGSLKEVCDRVKEFIKENQIPKGTWVCGRGWNQDYFQDEKRFITCRDLDQVSAEHPIFLARACGHVVSVNSKAMELAGVTRETTRPSDGRFQVDHEGEPNGVFEENGISLVKDAIPPVTIQKVKEFILTAQRALNSFGITTVHTDDFLSLNGVDYEMVLRAYRELEEEGRQRFMPSGMEVWRWWSAPLRNALRKCPGRTTVTASSTVRSPQSLSWRKLRSCPFIPMPRVFSWIMTVRSWKAGWGGNGQGIPISSGPCSIWARACPMGRTARWRRPM